MSTTFLHEFERDPARYIRKLLAEATRRMDAQAAETARAVRETELREAYAKRHQPDGPEAA